MSHTWYTFNTLQLVTSLPLLLVTVPANVFLF